MVSNTIFTSKLVSLFDSNFNYSCDFESILLTLVYSNSFTIIIKI